MSGTSWPALKRVERFCQKTRRKVARVKAKEMKPIVMLAIERGERVV